MLKKGTLILLVWLLIFNYSLGGELTNREDTHSQIVTKEQFLEFFHDMPECDRYEIYLDGSIENTLSLGQIAKILCDFIKVSPVYLPKEKNCLDPYIGRLVIEGLWGKLSTDSKAQINNKQWEELWLRVQNFKKGSKYTGTITNSSDTFRKVCVGKGSIHNISLHYDGETYKAYNILNNNYISLQELRNLGMNIYEQSGAIFITRDEELGQWPVEKYDLDSNIYVCDKNVYIGYLKVYALTIDKEIFIPIKALNTYYNLYKEDKDFRLEDKVAPIHEYIHIDNQYITNLSDEPIKLSYTDIFWNGKEFIEEEYCIEKIMPKEKMAKTDKLYGLDKKVTYVTTIINQLESNTYITSNIDFFGQNNAYFFNIYSKKIAELEEKVTEDKKNNKQELFPETVIMARVKYNTNNLKKGEQVEVLSAEIGSYYMVHSSMGTKVKVPWGSLDIPQNPKVEKNIPSNREIEDFINNQNLDSKTQYLVWTDLYRQRTYVFKGNKNNWKLIKNLLCSTGNNISPTPKGIYELQSRIPYFGVDKGYRCKNAFQIQGDYLYHSIIFDKTGTRLLEGKGVLGQRASQGCIRFSEEDSLWFYNTMKPGTKVLIR